MKWLILFCLFYQHTATQTIATSNPRTYFKPNLKRKESRLTGCQILTLQEIDYPASLNNPFLARNRGYSTDTHVIKGTKAIINGTLKTATSLKPIKFTGLKPGNHEASIITKNKKLKLNFALKWEQETLILVLVPKDKNLATVAMMQQKKVLAGIEFRQMLAKLKIWRERFIKLQNLETDFKPWISSEYSDDFGKKEDLVDFLSIWQKKLNMLNFQSIVLQPNNDKLRFFVKLDFSQEFIQSTKCYQLLFNRLDQLIAYENQDCNQSYYIQPLLDS